MRAQMNRAASGPSAGQIPSPGRHRPAPCGTRVPVLPLRLLPLVVPLLGLSLLAGCASRAVDVRPEPASPAEFSTWGCGRIDDELDRVQQRAADVAYAVDERAGHNILALGLGLGIFWPAILAMRPDGLEAADLARLKGRYEALRAAGLAQGCPPPGVDLPPGRAAALPVAVGDRLVYEDRSPLRGPVAEWALRVAALRRDEIEFRLEVPPPRAGSTAPAVAPAPGGASPWRQDLAGNVSAVPPGALHWQRLLRRDLTLGQVVTGEIRVAGDPLLRARLRGQVVAVGPQVVAERRFDAAVIELFGDALRGDAGTRLEGAIVVDRASGVLLRLDLTSAVPEYSLQRRLSRVEKAQP